LLNSLKQSLKDWDEMDHSTLASIFVDAPLYLRGYEEYAANFSESTEMFADAKQNNPVFKKFLNSPAVRKGGGLMDIHDFLISPIQRLPRYEMLLKEFLKSVPKRRKDHAILQRAYETMQSICQKMNEARRMADGRRKKKAIENMLHGSVNLSTSRSLFIREGVFPVIGKNGKVAKKPSYFCLFSDLLVEAKELPKVDKCGKTHKLVQQLPLTGISVFLPAESAVQNTFTVSVDSDGHEYSVMCSSQYEKKQWIKDINEYKSEMEVQLQKIKDMARRRGGSQKSNITIPSSSSQNKLSISDSGVGGKNKAKTIDLSNSSSAMLETSSSTNDSNSNNNDNDNNDNNNNNNNGGGDNDTNVNTSSSSFSGSISLGGMSGVLGQNNTSSGSLTLPNAENGGSSRESSPEPPKSPKKKKGSRREKREAKK